MLNPLKKRFPSLQSLGVSEKTSAKKILIYLKAFKFI